MYYYAIQVNNNGLISFSSSLPDPSYIPVSLPIADNPFVAPFWADIDTRGTGTVWIRETRNSTILDRVREDIQETFDGLLVVTFQPHFAIIATWDRVGYFNNNTDLVSIRLQ